MSINGKGDCDYEMDISIYIFICYTFGSFI